MRKNYQMTDEQLKILMTACKPVPMIALSAGMPASPQENANSAWESLGKEMGFKFITVEPIQGKPTSFFTAEETNPD